MRLITMRQFVIVLLLLTVCVCGQQSNRTSETAVGAISGLVVDQNDQPVEGAIVTVQPEDTQLIGKTPVAKSGPGGRFVLNRIPSGKNFLFASKPNEGYPDTQLAVFTPKDIVLDSISVEAGKTISNIILRMPKKGGKIVGRIIDAQNGHPVLTARIHLFQASDPDRDISTSPTLGAEFEFAVPPIAYKMEVNAPHYKPWKYDQAGGPGAGDILLASPGSTRQLVVKLEPDSPAPR